MCQKRNTFVFLKQSSEKTYSHTNKRFLRQDFILNVYFYVLFLVCRYTESTYTLITQLLYSYIY